VVERVGENVGSILWEGSIELCKYLFCIQDRLRSSNIIELGAGIGLCEIFAALHGAKVTITDRKELLELIEYNVKENALDGKVAAMEYLWGSDVTDLPRPYHFVLASDVLYSVSSIKPLLEAILLLCDQTTEVFLAYRQRDSKEQEFFLLAANHFLIQKIDPIVLGKVSVLFVQEETAISQSQRFKRQTEPIQLFIIKRKPQSMI